MFLAQMLDRYRRRLYASYMATFQVTASTTYIFDTDDGEITTAEQAKQVVRDYITYDITAQDFEYTVLENGEPV